MCSGGLAVRVTGLQSSARSGRLVMEDFCLRRNQTLNPKPQTLSTASKDPEPVSASNLNSKHQAQTLPSKHQANTLAPPPQPSFGKSLTREPPCRRRQPPRVGRRSAPAQRLVLLCAKFLGLMSYPSPNRHESQNWPHKDYCAFKAEAISATRNYFHRCFGGG